MTVSPKPPEIAAFERVMFGVALESPAQQEARTIAEINSAFGAPPAVGGRAIGGGLAVALNAEGAAPEWIMLLPAGPVIRGQDGRTWRMSDPEKVARATMAAGLKPSIDFNHAQYLQAPKGGANPAAGWIEALEVRAGAIWGRVEWTARGSSALAAREYRYISPALKTGDDGEVIAILNAGLVNNPNLPMPALNAEL